MFKLHHLLPSPLFFYFQAAKETGALQAAKNKLEKQVEELTWRLQLEKRMRVKFWFTLFDRCSGFVYLHGRDIKKMINYVKFTLLTTQHMPIEYRLNFSEWVQKYAVAFFFSNCAGDLLVISLRRVEIGMSSMAGQGTQQPYTTLQTNLKKIEKTDRKT